jgi:hypothetical protein
MSSCHYLHPIKGVDGRVMHDILIPAETGIIVSIINSNRDPALWGTGFVRMETGTVVVASS